MDCRSGLGDKEKVGKQFLETKWPEAKLWSKQCDSFPVSAPFPALGLPASRSLPNTGSQQAAAICLQLLTPFSQATSFPSLSFPSNKQG